MWNIISEEQEKFIVLRLDLVKRVQGFQILPFIGF